MATWTWLVWLVVWCVLGILEHACGFTDDSPMCGSYAELYFANVAGRIPGGVDIVSRGDQTPCHKRPQREGYRELDGRCNHPLDFGSTMKPIKRYIKAHYQDAMGYNTPRMFSGHGNIELLPSPRAISRTLHDDRNKLDTLTMWVMQLGQFIDHDITSAPVPTEHNSSIKCCGVPSNRMPKECFPISVPRGDRTFSSCMEFVRSEPVKDRKGHVIYPREQLNALTSFVDGSAIYGSSKETLARLRVGNGKGALLKTRLVNGKERLPHDTAADSDMCLAAHNRRSFCQLSGDGRVNEHPGLGSCHLLFHLFHNHIVRALVTGFLGKGGHPNSPVDVERYLYQKPDALQETIFQEARKIVGAVLQKITYCDWLPLVVGPALIRKYSLGCHGRSSYNHFVDPRIANGFLSAAFRFGHSLIPDTMKINHVKLDLKDQFMIPDPVLLFYESIMEGMQESRSQQKFDRHVVGAVTNHLFESSKGPQDALDLIALNIQRGRDHGIPAYHVWRKYYGLRSFRRTRCFRPTMSLIRRVYREYEDVDLFVGGLLEKPVRGGIVGETFGNIIANQFSDLKFGDAYFFMGEEKAHAFTDEQLQMIKRFTLRDIVCVCGGVQKSQRNVFRIPNHRNPQIPCDDYHDFDITPWSFGLG